MNQIEIAKIEVDKPESMNALQDIYDDYIKTWYPRYEEYAQGRTDFQIEKFISCEDVTPANTYHTVLYQTRVMREELMREIREGIKLHRTFEYKWDTRKDNGPIEWKTKEGGIEYCWYDLDLNELQVRLSSIALSTKDRLQQLNLFDRILNKLIEINKGEFTYQQLRDEEPEYWKVRFTRQIIEDVLMAKTGINGGNVRSIRMAMQTPMLEGSTNVISDFPDIFNAMLSGDPKIMGKAISDMSTYVQNAADKSNYPKALKSQEDIKRKLGILSE